MSKDSIKTDIDSANQKQGYNTSLVEKRINNKGRFVTEVLISSSAYQGREYDKKVSQVHVLGISELRRKYIHQHLKTKNKNQLI